jgi:hypothetical protein
MFDTVEPIWMKTGTSFPYQTLLGYGTGQQLPHIDRKSSLLVFTERLSVQQADT